VGNKIRKSVEAIRQGGFRLLFFRSFRYVWREHLRGFSPTVGYHSISSGYHKIAIEKNKMMDQVFGYSEKRNYLWYESGILRFLAEATELSDDVTIIGGGRGVSAVAAYRESGVAPTVYEPSDERIQRIKGTIELNEAKADIRHVSIGPVKKKRGDISDSSKMSPNDLDECDLLEIDAEGSEIEILRNLEIEPETVIVETHGCYGSPTKKVKHILTSDLGYEIDKVRIANGTAGHSEKDVKVIKATK
jgi:hypothetical protein